MIDKIPLPKCKGIEMRSIICRKAHLIRLSEIFCQPANRTLNSQQALKAILRACLLLFYSTYYIHLFSALIQLHSTLILGFTPEKIFRADLLRYTAIILSPKKIYLISILFTSGCWICFLGSVSERMPFVYSAVIEFSSIPEILKLLQ